MFPAAPQHGTVLGGTFDRGVESTGIDPAAVERTVRGNAELSGGVRRLRRLLDAVHNR
jgi:hypothetical protein